MLGGGAGRQRELGKEGVVLGGGGGGAGQVAGGVGACRRRLGVETEENRRTLASGDRGESGVEEI